MENVEILRLIRRSFDSLLKMRPTGKEEFEITTPFCVTSDKYVSVFICRVTPGVDLWEVHDGEWIMDGRYGVSYNYKNPLHKKMMEHFIDYYKVNRSYRLGGSLSYSKRTTDPDMIPNLVYDVGSFISQLLSSIDALED